MSQIAEIRSLLQKSIDLPEERRTTFYKTAPGEYAAHDQFIGVRVPTLRKIAKQYSHLSLEDIEELLSSLINEERLLALIILANSYKKANIPFKNELYHFYLRNLRYVNNWNLVDASAHLIIGAQLLDSNKESLLALAKSEVMWQRRVAIVATWYFIHNNQLDWTFRIAEELLNDTHYLIHKAVGWMLREAGKRDLQKLTHFLSKHAPKMPRTMLRYAIERLPESQRKAYLVGPKPF